MNNFIKNNYILCIIEKKYGNIFAVIALWDTLKRSLKLIYCNDNNWSVKKMKGYRSSSVRKKIIDAIDWFAYDKQIVQLKIKLEK